MVADQRLPLRRSRLCSVCVRKGSLIGQSRSKQDLLWQQSPESSKRQMKPRFDALDAFYFCFGQLREAIIKVEPDMKQVIMVDL